MRTVFESVISSQLTLPAILRWRAQHEPLREAYTFLLDGETKQVQMTYADLDREARRIAALLQDRIVPGERALLLYPPSLEYVAAVFGCFYAGVIAVPAYPPRLNQNLIRMQAILQDAQATVALTTATTLSAVRRKFANDPLMQHLQWIETDTAAQERAECYREVHPGPQALALLQYTSGSTSSPKGIMLTHTHLMQNAAILRETMELTSEERGLSWLPPYHDLGLMADIL